MQLIIIRGVWARNSNFLGLHCRVSEKKNWEINLFHLENIYLWGERYMVWFYGLDSRPVCLPVQMWKYSSAQLGLSLAIGNIWNVGKIGEKKN